MSMSRKVFFFNNYKLQQETPEFVKSFVDLNGKISSNFISKTQNFQDEKLYLLRDTSFYDRTIYTGSAGLALYYFAVSLKNVANEQDRIESLLKALDYLDLHHLKGRRITFLCGDAGPLALAIVIYFKLGNHRPDYLPSYEYLAQRLISLSSLIHKSPDELLYGGAGYLYALLFVNKYVPEKEIIPSKQIRHVVNSILSCGKRFALKMKCESPLLWEWHGKVYLGAAHGVAGILYMLLQARSYIDEKDLHELIKPTIDWLITQRFPSGNFPSSAGNPTDKLVQWCHGAPGFVPLFILASEVFHDNVYMKLALQCGEVVWERGLCCKGYSICHGVSGNAYTFLQLYQATKDSTHLYRACCFMDWCMKENAGTELHVPDRPASLFEGVIGRMYLAQDLMNPEEALFPAMSL